MNFTKGILLGSAASLLSIAAASAADLPSRKSAPVEYVKVCSAYGAGFFFIPGTDTCLKIGGRVRADYNYVPAKDTYSALGTANTLTTETYAVSGANGVKAATTGSGTTQVIATSSLTPAGNVYATTAIAANTGYWTKKDGEAGTKVGRLAQDADSQNTWGGEARARVDLDARTGTAYGTVQAVASIRLARGYGSTSQAVANTDGHGSSPTLEAAYIRFAGFTAGSARDNFAFMPSLTYGAGHWASFGNGATQLAYTATFGGGISATLALQNHGDTTAKIATATTSGYIPTHSSATPSSYGVSSELAATTPYKSMPQLVGNFGINQSWGEVRVMGAFARLDAVSLSKSTAAVPAAISLDRDVNVWALGAGVKLELPMLAKGSSIWFTGAMANGMTEYTTNYGSFKGSAFARDVGGYVVNHPSVVVYKDTIETVKSWNVAALGQHFWAPQWRSVAWASYGQIDAPETAKKGLWNGTTYFGDATVWNVGKNFAWLPTRGMEIGVEVIYSRVSQTINGIDGSAGAGVAGADDQSRCWQPPSG